MKVENQWWLLLAIESTKTNENLRKAYFWYGETSDDLDWRPDTKAYPFQQHDDHDQSKKLVCNVERRG
jgi:hypothetical protein